jgi:hypothetical protein
MSMSDNWCHFKVSSLKVVDKMIKHAKQQNIFPSRLILGVRMYDHEREKK